MIDYIKARTHRIDPSVCERSKEIELDSIHRTKQREGFATTLIYKFAALTIRTTEHYTYIEGSLHKMYNHIYANESQNYNDFDFVKLYEIVRFICDHLNIAADQIKLQNLEYGLNLHTSISPSVILGAHTICYKSRPVSVNLDEIQGAPAKYYRWQITGYWLKLYDKGLHYQKRQNIIRLEKKLLKSRAIKALGIETLADLANEKIIPLLADDLKKEWSQILMVDYLQGSPEMSYEERNLFLIMVNPKTYEAYQASTKNPNQRKAMERLKKEFQALKELYSFDSIHTKIGYTIKAKIAELSKNVTKTPIYVKGVFVTSTVPPRKKRKRIYKSRYDQRMAELSQDKSKRFDRRIAELSKID